MKIWFWIGTLVGLAAGIFGLVRGWDLIMYGGGAIAAACLFAIFVQNYPWILAIIGIGAALAVAGPYLWHTKVKHLQGQTPPDAKPTE